MNRSIVPRGRIGIRPRTDAQGELVDAPTWLRPVWIALVGLTLLESFEELGWIGGPAVLYQRWIHDAVLAAAAVLIMARALYEPVARRAWLSFGLATTLWCLGTISWSIAYGDQVRPPYPTFADCLWLLWYPLMAAGMVFLIQVRFRSFEVHRWMDGIAVVLIVLAAGFALVVQPVTEQSSEGGLATVIAFSYPVLDVLLIGALLGVYGLLGWRPDSMWIFIGLGILACTSADAAFAVEHARGNVENGHYDFVWTLGALCIAYAAWVREPTVHDDAQRVTGMRAIALALIAQALAIAIQIFAVFKEVGKSERVVTVFVLVVTSVQIVLTRPRARIRAETPAARPRAGTPEWDADPGSVESPREVQLEQAMKEDA